MKQYGVFESGSKKVAEVKATCISKACQRFIATLERPCAWVYKLDSREQASVRFLLNETVVNDYIVISE